jgi:L-threonylcarbamoyladenylate synthase
MVDFEQDIKACAAAIEAGGTILYPTDTVWGIGCDALNAQAISAVFALKKRPIDKGLIVLLAEARDVLHYVAAPPPDIISIIESFQTPTTIVFDHALGFPDALTGQFDSIAIRVTQDPFCKALIKRVKRPIVSTSANISGSSTPSTFAQIDSEVVSGVGYVAQWRRNETQKRVPSTIVRVTDDGETILLR